MVQGLQKADAALTDGQNRLRGRWKDAPASARKESVRAELRVVCAADSRA